MLEIILIPIALVLYGLTGAFWCVSQNDRREGWCDPFYGRSAAIITGAFAMLLSWTIAGALAIGPVGIFCGYVWMAQQLEWFKIERRGASNAEVATLDSNSSIC